MNRPIIELMDERIEQLERYNAVTEEMLNKDIDDFESFDGLLDEREKLLSNMEGISMGIKKFISEQSIERQDKLNALFRFEDIGELSGEMLEIQEKIMKVKELRERITSNDRKAFSRIKSERDVLKERLESAAKSKQVVDYFSQSAVDVTKGSKLNISN